MEELRIKSAALVNSQAMNFKRTLYHKIDWTNRLIGILGSRGTGKTTLQLQKLKEITSKGEDAIYLSLDDISFTKTRLNQIVEALRLEGVKYFFLDEVHKYPDWAREIKNIYDFYHDISIVFTGSSIINMLQLPVDLSRRALIHELPGLSFREFLEYDQNIVFNTCTLEQIIEDHQSLASKVLEKVQPVMLFNAYLSNGYYPFYKENRASYPTRLLQVIRLVIDYDLAFIENIDHQNIRKVFQLLGILSEHVPFTPNINDLSKKLAMGRNTLVQYLHYLEKARLINNIYASGKGFGKLEKPGKILLENTNLFEALSVINPDKGSVRESFFANQLKNSGYNIELPAKGDFLINHQYTFEVGGRQKGYEQIAGIPDSYIASADIELGVKNKIPLWLFGFLY